MNETLCRALIRADLTLEDVAARLDVDPKTVRSWLEGRLPYRRNRWALAAILGVGDLDLWPELRGQTVMSDDVVSVYPHRDEVPADVWLELLGSAGREIGILQGGSAFLPLVQRTVTVLNDRAAAGVGIRVCWLGGDAGASRGASGSLSRFAPLRGYGTVEFRLHPDRHYSDLCFADDRMLVGQLAFGVHAERCPVMVLERHQASGLFAVYCEAFERTWAISCPYFPG